MKGVIIAGGLGTRLRPLTNHIPKPIIPVMNKPFVLYQIELLKRHGIDRIIVNVHYQSHRVQEVLGDGSAWGVKLEYSIEQEPLGTAWAVKNAESLFDEGPLVVLNGDVLTDIDLGELLGFHREKKAAVTLTLTEVQNPSAFGLVLTDESQRVKAFLEKPANHISPHPTINAGIYVIDPAIFQQVPSGVAYSFERELYPTLLSQDVPVYGFISGAYWIDIGNPQMYLQVHDDLFSGKVKGFSPEESLLQGEDCEVSPDVFVGGWSVLGNHVKVGAGSLLNRSVIWEGTSIGKEASITGSIIGRNCRIGDGAALQRGVVLEDGTTIEPGLRIS